MRELTKNVIGTLGIAVGVSIGVPDEVGCTHWERDCLTSNPAAGRLVKAS